MRATQGAIEKKKEKEKVTTSKLRGMENVN